MQFVFWCTWLILHNKTTTVALPNQIKANSVPVCLGGTNSSLFVYVVFFPEAAFVLDSKDVCSVLSSMYGHLMKLAG